MDISATPPPYQWTVDRELAAEERAKLPPADDAARDRWVERTFDKANEEVAAFDPQGLQAKVDKMARGPFPFFRGAAHLFYLDLARYAPPMQGEPRVPMVGDVHPENFGTYVSERGTLMYDINDFDETAQRGPCTWDLRRGAAGWMLAARQAGHGPRRQQKIARAFLDGFRDQLKEADPASLRVDLQTATGPVRDLLLKAAAKDPKAFVERITEPQPDGTRRFKPSPSLIPQSHLRDTMAELLQLEVEDVAKQIASGTASLGVPRYYALIPGEAPRVVELKQEIKSALRGVPYAKVHASPHRAQTVERAARTLPAEAYPDLGALIVDVSRLPAIPSERHTASFLLRQRPALKSALELDKLTVDQMKDAARTQGRLVAAALARIGREDAREVRKFLKEGVDLIPDAAASADRVAADYDAFCAAHGRAVYTKTLTDDPE